MINYTYTVWIVLIPLFMFVILGLFGMKMKNSLAGILGSLGLFTSTVLSYITAYYYFFKVGPVDGVFQSVSAYNIKWLSFTDTLSVHFGVFLDPISVMMLVVVTTVSLMCHIYSIGYMKGDTGFQRFFSFLSLFTFSMLFLVIATDIIQMYIGFELVGLSSYLLIGHYYEKPAAVAAANKAFIVTRFADFGFFVGILLVSFYTGTFDFTILINGDGSIFAGMAAASFMGMNIITWAMLLIFIGGAGKSAMFPLHIWLPDAMEGPTPVSALIHAATMVVAGVYLVARMFIVFHFQAPDALEVVAYVGAFTSLFTAVIAITQYDIKRILAFSTLSQIGYMILALGVSGYGGEEGVGYMASMFHLTTHAMFKALLFLGAGSIIHAIHSNDLRDMGGLRKYMPITFITFAIAVLSISGIPPFSGFWSKDEILAAAFEHNKIIYFSSVLVAGLTAFYMSRLFFTVFFGKKTEYHHTPHESPWVMTIPLLILSIGATFAGFIPFNELVTSDGAAFESHLSMSIALPSIAIALLGIFFAFLLYYKKSNTPDKITRTLGFFYKTTLNKFYFDELYLFVTKKIIFNIISQSIAWFDRHVVDGSMNGIAWVIEKTSVKSKELQSGQLQQYAFIFVAGTIILVLCFAYLFN
ncbi:MAG: NADH-quinone oxidoreductase subunit L [Bacteroidetes bacterium CG02_land_8_20_14_3_00_31_25]|nr:MAG: NADH-quinone oxidoreductase subunit L [Bacteroidetes bacterium CG02_land_8_20_14_3_00_31_25]